LLHFVIDYTVRCCEKSCLNSLQRLKDCGPKAACSIVTVTLDQEVEDFGDIVTQRHLVKLV